MHTLQSYYDKTISIHAPARGATLDKIEGNVYAIISIHAPARGATTTAQKTV